MQRKVVETEGGCVAMARGEKMKIMVSACLMGKNCKYNGGSNRNQRVLDFVKEHEVIEVCPEILAGLGCPRTPIEIVDGILTDREGNVVDAQLRQAIAHILSGLEGEGIDLAVLQSRSPTCGVKEVYDGTFLGRKIPGSGVFAQALREVGIKVLDAEDI